MDERGYHQFLWLIVLVCGTNCGLALSVSRCHEGRFDTMLCSPGFVIKVTGLTQSTSINGGPAGCHLAITDCTRDISGSNYYQTVQTACDGKLACTDLTASAQTRYCEGNTESTYITIRYQCDILASEDVKTRTHYHTRNFDVTLCPVGSVIRVLDLYVGRQQSFKVGDCAQQRKRDLEVFRTSCDGHIRCTGTYSVRGPIHCEGSSHMSTYTLLVYRCVTIGGTAVSRCHGRRFDTMLCSPGSVIKVTGLTQSTSINGRPAGCPSATTDCTADISGSNYYQSVQTACDGKLACTDLTATAQTQFCEGITESTYITIRYQCETLAPEDVKTRIHEYTRNFDVTLCPVGSVIRVLDLYVGRQQSFRVGDCAQQRKGDLEVFRRSCDGHISCTGTYAVLGPIHCEGSSHMGTYTILVYGCVPSITSTFSTRLIASTEAEFASSTDSTTYSMTYTDVTDTYFGQNPTPTKITEATGEMINEDGTSNLLGRPTCNRFNCDIIMTSLMYSPGVAVSVPMIVILVTVAVVLSMYFVRRRRQSNLPDHAAYVNQVVSINVENNTTESGIRKPNNTLNKSDQSPSATYQDLLNDNRDVIQHSEYMCVSPDAVRYENVQNILTTSESVPYEDITQGTGNMAVPGGEYTELRRIDSNSQ